MDKEDLKRIVDDPRLIPGIYNYCDRWCERCPFTSRCANFAIGEKQFAEPEDRERDILDILVHLTRLRRRTEELFPDARAFVRPGFDECQADERHEPPDATGD